MVLTEAEKLMDMFSNIHCCTVADPDILKREGALWRMGEGGGRPLKNSKEFGYYQSEILSFIYIRC
jgi:hypothetical protein